MRPLPGCRRRKAWLGGSGKEVGSNVSLAFQYLEVRGRGGCIGLYFRLRYFLSNMHPQEGKALHEMKNGPEPEDRDSDPPSVHLLTVVVAVSAILSLSVLLWGKSLLVSWFHSKDGVLFTKSCHLSSLGSICAVLTEF